MCMALNYYFISIINFITLMIITLLCGYTAAAAEVKLLFHFCSVMRKTKAAVSLICIRNHFD